MIDNLISNGFVTFDSVFWQWTKKRGFLSKITPVNEEEIFVRPFTIYEEWFEKEMQGYDVAIYLKSIKRWAYDEDFWDTQILPPYGYKQYFINTYADGFSYTDYKTPGIPSRKEGAKYNETTGVLYFYRAGKYVKIGISSNPMSRRNAIGCHCPIKGDYVANFFYKNPRVVEQLLHKKLEKYRSNREWFKLSDKTLNNWLLFLSVTNEDALVNTSWSKANFDYTLSMFNDMHEYRMNNFKDFFEQS